MTAFLNYLVHNLWWPYPAAVAFLGLGAVLGSIGRRT